VCEAINRLLQLTYNLISRNSGLDTTLTTLSNFWYKEITIDVPFKQNGAAGYIKNQMLRYIRNYSILWSFLSCLGFQWNHFPFLWKLFWNTGNKYILLQIGLEGIYITNTSRSTVFNIAELSNKTIA